MAKRISCKIKGCKNKIKCKNLCHKHYNNLWNSKNKDKLSVYEASNNRRFKRLTTKCKRLSIEIDLSFEDWLKIIAKNECFYCSDKLPKNGYALDRKSPKLGYLKENVVACCDTCNKTKRSFFTHEEFKVMIDALLEYRKTCGRKTI